MKRVLASRGFISVLGACTVAIVVVVAYLLVAQPMRKKLSYCALMPDAVGLYEGNQVTMRGIAVGTVTTVRPHGAGVRVDFTTDADHPLRGKVTATTVSDTLVADRTLAVLGDGPSSAPWPGDRCITETFTPKSISESLAAFTQLSKDLGGGDPDDRAVRQSLDSFAAATSGTGPSLNALINQLGRVLRSPDAAIGHIGALIDATASLSSAVAANWDDIKVALTQAPDGLAFINQVWDTTTQLIDSMQVIFPWLDNLAREYGRPLLNGLDAAGPGLKLLAANVGTIQQLLDLVPPVVDAMRRTVDPQTGRVTVNYAQPSVALPAPAAAQICTAVDALRPGSCADGSNGLTKLPLLPLVLQLSGAR
ncbi:Mce family protein MceD [Nocardia nova SH22a]|uniref:Mce family protein MceD n=1 Tax=Nocardia nova SH22a TaxID=1415166 RepID=W5THK6_9NOCA|nr:MlaD family protein [Nocardia nova]AHH18453.1 Mce family protein MceD [Nocardia nova SH22a]